MNANAVVNIFFDFLNNGTIDLAYITHALYSGLYLQVIQLI